MLAGIVPLVPADNTLDPSLIRLDLDRWHGDKALHTDEDGVHILLRSGSEEHRLWLRSVSALPDGAPLNATLDFGAYTAERADAMLRFWRHVVDPPSSRQPSRQPVPQHTLRQARMLQALDGLSAGATHRDIARVLFGEKRVREDWGRGSRLRETIGYLVHGARALMDGGYRGLLKPPKRRRDE